MSGEALKLLPILTVITNLVNSVQSRTDVGATSTLSYHYRNSIGGHFPSERRKRAPAVWGEPAPDYSAAQLEGGTTFLYALLFVDLKISDHYRRDHKRVKTEVMKLAQEANKYFYQINLHLVIVDVLETMRSDLSLYTFEDYRNRRMTQLPYHNFAALISYRYAGGLAFVSGMCSAKSVMMAGYYPHNPEAMGSIFFHEVAHLIGVPHSRANETLSVPNCACTQQPPQQADRGREPFQPRQLPSGVENNEFMTNLSVQGRRKASVGCLKIPGFDHDCTLQLMANLVYRNRCLPRQPRTRVQNMREGFQDARDHGEKLEDDDESLPTSLPLCGNGYLEEGEECDCGIERLCSAWNCDPANCTRPIPSWLITLSLLVLGLAIVAPLLLYIYLREGLPPSKRLPRFVFIRQGPSALFAVFKPNDNNNGQRVSVSSISAAFAVLKRLVLFRKREQPELGEFRTSRTFRNERLYKLTTSALKNPLNKTNPSPVIIRPPMPPPPPPYLPSGRSMSSRQSNTSTGRIERPKACPPPPPTTFNGNTLQSSSTLTRPKIPPPPRPPLSPVPNRIPSPREKSTPPRDEDRFSISHKFEDFDDEGDFDSDFDENFATIQD